MNWIIVLSLVALIALVRSPVAALVSLQLKNLTTNTKNFANSDTLDDMLAGIKLKADPLARHRLLTRIIEKTYKERRQADMQKIFLRFAAIHIKELPQIQPALKDITKGARPNISTFKLLAIFLEEINQYDEAVAVCEQALQLGTHDGTKTGFEGRIKRLRKKMDLLSIPSLNDRTVSATIITKMPDI